MASLNRRVALAIFGALVLAAPLLFGASDRVVQIGLLAGLALGCMVAPPAVPRLSRWLKIAIALLIGVVIVKEFLPFAWFGGTVVWRKTLTQDYGVAFPATHNPEPGRAVDAILALAAAGAWFVWVRALVDDRRDRLVIAWCLFGAAAVVAVMCLALGYRSDWMIYGWRYTPGWRGYGPFPNRNHSATLLAMGALVGCGCTVRAARRKQWAPFCAGLPGIAVIFVAMLESKSRGGLI